MAAALRLTHLHTAYELFIDEVTYSDLAASVAAGDGVGLDGRPFDLHPPLLFLVFGALLRALGTDLGDPFSLVDTLRPVEAVTGALVCGLLVLLVARVAPRPVAVLAGLALALDPFAIRFDSRVMLEAPAMFLTLLGLLAVTRTFGTEQAGSHGHRAGIRAALLAGVVLGLAVLIKETFAFVAVAPLLLSALVLRPYRRRLLVAVATAVGVYLAYLVVLVGVGRAGHWSEQKLSGVRRLLGLEQLTGFNKPGSTSFSARVLELLGTFAVTYAIIGAATAVAVVAALTHLLARRRRSRGGGELHILHGGEPPILHGGEPPILHGGEPPILHRGELPTPRPVAVLLVATQLSAASYLAYAMTLGTLEEQAFYLVVAPSVAVLALAVARVLGRGVHAARSRARTAVAASVTVLPPWWPSRSSSADSAAWWRVHTVADDGYRQYVAWVRDNLRPTDRLAVTDDTAQFITPGVVLGSWSTPEQVRANDADYVLVAQRLVEAGLGKGDEALVTWLDANGDVVLDVRTPSLESLRVYRVGR